MITLSEDPFSEQACLVNLEVSLLNTAMAIQCRAKWIASERNYRDPLDYFRLFSSSSIAGQEWGNTSVTPNCERPLLSCV